MNRAALPAALAFLLAAPLAFAQPAQPPAPIQREPAAQSAGPAHAPNPHRQAVRLSRQLNLSPDQASKLEPILADRDQKLAALRADSSLAPRAERQQLRAIRRNTQAQLSQILTPDQMQQFRSIQQAHSHRAQPQAAPAPAV